VARALRRTMPNARRCAAELFDLEAAVEPEKVRALHDRAGRLPMRDTRAFTYGIALGAGLMFLFDPLRGAARRAGIRQKAMRTAHEVETAAGIGARDLEHRVEGIAARLGRIVTGRESNVSGDVLVARVRSELGHVCSHPRAVEVTAKGDGRIELKGPILREDLGRVVDTAAHVPGVTTIDDALEVHDHPQEHPALQGPTLEPKRKLFASPATRFVIGVGGASACALALVKGSALGLVAGVAVVVGAARSILRRGGARALPSPPQVKGLREAYPEGSEWAPAEQPGPV